MAESSPRELIEKIADEVRPDATKSRVRNIIRLILDSFAPDHVMTELLQNADDLGATKARIELTRSGVIVSHDGEAFNEAHLRALCDIGQTTKKAGIHIGFMGVGFKAAFKVTDTPYVFCGPFQFHFTRDEVIVPHWVDEAPPDLSRSVREGFTTFYLPYREDLPDVVKKVLQETALRNLEPLSLVFLRNIKTLEIVASDTVRKITKNTQVLASGSPTCTKALVLEKNNDKGRVLSYLVYSKSLPIPDNIKKDSRVKDSGRADLQTTGITIAFGLKDGVVEPMKSVLYTFLPTPYQTGLEFALNCDFLLNTQRTEIDLGSKWNHWLLENLGDLLKEVVDGFIQDDKQKFSFYDVLPRRESSRDVLFEEIAVPLIEHMKNSTSVTASEGIRAKPSEVVVAAADVQKIIPPDRAGVLHYVHPKTKGRAFLRQELGIHDLSSHKDEREYVMEALSDASWLKSLDAGHVRSMYEYLQRKLYLVKGGLWELPWQEHQQVENSLKQLEIVRCKDESFHKGDEVLYLKSSEEDLVDKIQSLNFLDPEVVSEGSLEFLTKMGVKECTADLIVTQILDNMGETEWEARSEGEKMAALRYVANWAESREYQIEQRLIRQLESVVLPVEGGKWKKASACYIGNKALDLLLPRADYVDTVKLRGVAKDTGKFLSTVGVLSFPRVLNLGRVGRWSGPPSRIPKANWDTYLSWLTSRSELREEGKNHYLEATQLDGFDESLEANNVARTKLYFELVLRHWEEYYKDHVYCYWWWSYYYDQTKLVTSYFAYRMKTSKWVPTTAGMLLPSEAFAPFREIKKVGGSVIPYLGISEERAKKAREFLDLLEVRTEVDLRTLLSILSAVREQQVDDGLKDLLGKIYERMSGLCEGEVVSREVFLLDKENEFKLSKSLYWLDDTELENAFGKELPAAWVPEGLARPQVETLFQALSVTVGSSMVKREIVGDETLVEDAVLTALLTRRGAYLYSLLLHQKAEDAKSFPDFISKATVLRAPDLRLRLELAGKSHDVRVGCFCSRGDAEIYVTQASEVSTALLDIAREITRAFNAPAASEFSLNFALSREASEVEDAFGRLSIRTVKLPIALVEEAPPESEPLEQAAVEESSAVVIHEMEETLKSPPVEAEPGTLEDREVTREVAVEIDKNEFAKEIASAKDAAVGSAASHDGDIDVWVPKKEIEKVAAEERVVVRPSTSWSARKEWKRAMMDGQEVYIGDDVSPELVEASKGNIKPFKERMVKIVEAMGGNPETVNICIANPVTDGDRREGQLFFNVARTDHPLRWIVVAARELAYVMRGRLGQQHVSVMTDLIVRALQKIQDLYPELFTAASHLETGEPSHEELETSSAKQVAN